MANLTIRNLDKMLIAKLCLQAAYHRRTRGQELGDIFRKSMNLP
ncbi:MAG: hypothetical protein ABL885_04360 [Methylophilaceae bacterium]